MQSLPQTDDNTQWTKKLPMLQNLVVHQHDQKACLCQFNPVHIFIFSLQSSLTFFSQVHLGLFTSDFVTEMSHAYIVSPMYAKCSTYPILIVIFSQIIFDEQYKL